MQLSVTETLHYAFNIPDDQIAEAHKNPEDWFTNLHNPVAEANYFEVTARACNLECDGADGACRCERCGDCGDLLNVGEGQNGRCKDCRP